MNLHGVYYPIVHPDARRLRCRMAGGTIPRGRVASGSLVTAADVAGPLWPRSSPRPTVERCRPSPSSPPPPPATTSRSWAGSPGAARGLYEFRAFVPQGVTAAMTPPAAHPRRAGGGRRGARRLRVAHLVLALGSILLLLRASQVRGRAVDPHPPAAPRVAARCWGWIASGIAGGRPACCWRCWRWSPRTRSSAKMSRSGRGGYEPISQRSELARGGRVHHPARRGRPGACAIPTTPATCCGRCRAAIRSSWRWRVPFLFHDEDWFEIKNAYFTADGMTAFLERHRPAFVLGSLDSAELVTLARPWTTRTTGRFLRRPAGGVGRSPSAARRDGGLGAGAGRPDHCCGGPTTRGSSAEGGLACARSSSGWPASVTGVCWSRRARPARSRRRRSANGPRAGWPEARRPAPGGRLAQRDRGGRVERPGRPRRRGRTPSSAASPPRRTRTARASSSAPWPTTGRPRQVLDAYLARLEAIGWLDTLGAGSDDLLATPAIRSSRGLEGDARSLPRARRPDPAG